MDDKDASSSSLRVESFSCYLNSAKDNFSLNVIEGVSNSSSAVISLEDTPYMINLGASKNTESEIGVFGADKYYNMKQYYYPNTSKYALDKERKVEPPQPDHQHLRPRSSSISSETSLNSQSALLQGLRRTASQTKQKRGLGARLFSSFGCKENCVDKKAVYINSSVQQHYKPGLKKVDQFTFPALNSGIGTMQVKKQCEEENSVQEDPRNSIEVFGSVMAKKGDVAMNMQRKLSILAWDAIPKKAQSPVTTSFGSSVMCDDMASDASSDLFEIDNISGTRYPVLLEPEPCNMSPTTQYAPSEASIQWSVVTASAADFSSAVSEYEGKSVSVTGDMITKRASNRISNNKDQGTKEVSKSSPSRLLGCRSHKAVRVAESTYKPNEKAKDERRN